MAKKIITKKKGILNIIYWIAIVLCWGGILYFERHDNVRKLNGFLEKPVTEINLTMEQKLADFEYFYDCIVTSVPVNTLKEFENRYGFSFAERYEIYKDMVEATENDLEFYCVMNMIGEEIPSFHTGIAYPDYKYYQTFGCWNINQLLDTRYIKSKAEFWNNTLKNNA